MRIGFRKSFELGPFRVTASRSGLGWSVGAGGFRTGVNAGGRKYTSAKVPGTGLTYRGSMLGLGCVIAVGAALLIGLGVIVFSFVFR